MNDKKIPKIITTLVICGGLIMGFNTLKIPVYANNDAQTVITLSLIHISEPTRH